MGNKKSILKIYLNLSNKKTNTDVLKKQQKNNQLLEKIEHIFYQERTF